MMTSLKALLTFYLLCQKWREKSFPISYLLVKSGRFLNGERKSKTLTPKQSVRDEGRNVPEIKAHSDVRSFSIYCVKVDGFLTANDREKAVCKCEREARRKSPFLLNKAQETKPIMVGGGRHSKNLVYTKRQKDIYDNRKHETTVLVWLVL